MSTKLQSNNKLELVSLDNVEAPRISSVVIAKSIGTTYKATNALILKHKKQLEFFGELPFKKDAGDRKTPAFLNEDQAIFLLTLSRNTAIVVDFKHRLVKEFSALKRKQAVIDANHAKVEWQEARELGKITHRHNTDTIQVFMSYAQAQGSNNYPVHGYTILTRMINKALCIANRESIDDNMLHTVATAEAICDNALNRGMRDNLPYKAIYKDASRMVNQFADMVASDA